MITRNLTKAGLLLTAVVATVMASFVVSLPGQAAGSTCELGPGASCRYQDFSHQDLRGRDLTGADLEYSNFTGTNLSGAKLGKAKLSYSNFTRADLTGTKLDGVFGQDAQFSHSVMTNASAIGAHLGRSNFRGATLNGINLTDASLVTSQLSSVHLQRARLVRTNLQGAELNGSQLDSSDLTGANLRQAHTVSTNFVGANLGSINATQANMTGANFFGVRLQDATFNNAELKNSSFVGANFHRTDLSYAYITGVNWSGSNLASDHKARGALYVRIYSHIDAYADYGTCSSSGSGPKDHVSCSGVNNDPNATGEFRDSARFAWGTQHGTNRRGFTLGGRGIYLTGESDMTLGTFYVHSAAGTIEHARVDRTTDLTARGHIGGPLAMSIGYHHAFLGNGYHLNVQGWVLRADRAVGSPH